MTAFLFDDFTDTDGTALTSHTGPTGATWTLPGSENGASATIFAPVASSGAGFLRNANATSVNGHYLSSGTPASADYWIRLTVKHLTTPANGGIGFTLRTDATCANCYLVQYNYQVGKWQAFKKVAGSFSQTGMPADVTQAFTANTGYEFYFSVVGSQIDFTVDGASVFSFTNGDVTAAGNVGLRITNGAAAGSDTTGIHITQITGDAGTDTELRSVGDSITVGWKASPQATKRWAYVLATALGWNDYTRSQSSTQIIDQTSDDRIPANNQTYLPIGRTSNDRWCWLSGYNDLRYNGTDANALETYTRCLRAALAWNSRVAADTYEMNNAAWTESGAGWAGSTVNGMIHTRYTSTQGDKTTASISGTAITVAYISRFGLATPCTALEVRIDNVLVDTIDTSFGTASGFTSGAGAARYAVMAKRYSGLAAGAHTVELKHNDSTASRICQLAYVVGTGGTAGARISVGDPTKVANWNLGAPYNVGSDAAVTSYSNAIATEIAALVADGYLGARHSLTNSYYVSGTDEDADGIHPNNTGYQHISNAFNASFVPLAPTIGTATAGSGSASVAFTASADNGGFAITGYTATSTPGGLTGTWASSPISVGGLTAGVSYTFTVHATNARGNSAESAASNSVSIPVIVPPADAPRPSGGFPSGDRGPSERQKRRSRILHGLEAEIVSSVAYRQAQSLDPDEQKRIDELRGEMQLRGLEAQSLHYTALADYRQRLIDAEIGERLRRIQDEKDVIALLLFAASV